MALKSQQMFKFPENEGGSRFKGMWNGKKDCFLFKKLGKESEKRETGKPQTPPTFNIYLFFIYNI